MNHSNDCRIHENASVCDCGVLAAHDAGGCAPPVVASAMPKDNEVDEKAENWEYCRDLRIAVTDGKNGARATLNGHGAPAGISLYHGDYVAELKAETAASAATVAELRAEVERLRTDAYKFRRLARLLDGFDFRLGRNVLMPPATYLDSVEITCEFQPGIGQSVIDAIMDTLTGADPT